MDMTSAMRVFALVVESGGFSAAARQLGISRATLYRWLQEPDFRETLDRLRKEILHVAEIEAQSMAQDAISVIFELMQSGSQRVRLDAALAALRLAQDARFTDRIAQRIDNLERAAHIRKKAQWPGV